MPVNCLDTLKNHNRGLKTNSDQTGIATAEQPKRDGQRQKVYLKNWKSPTEENKKDSGKSSRNRAKAGQKEFEEQLAKARKLTGDLHAALKGSPCRWTELFQ